MAYNIKLFKKIKESQPTRRVNPHITTIILEKDTTSTTWWTTHTDTWSSRKLWLLANQFITRLTMETTRTTTTTRTSLKDQSKLTESPRRRLTTTEEDTDNNIRIMSKKWQTSTEITKLTEIITKRYHIEVRLNLNHRVTGRKNSSGETTSTGRRTEWRCTLRWDLLLPIIALSIWSITTIVEMDKTAIVWWDWSARASF